MPTLGEVIGKDLAGYTLHEAFWAELRHGLGATFPAVYTASEMDIIVCLQEELMKKIIKLLPERASRINRIVILVSPDGSWGLNTERFQDNDKLHSDLKSLIILTEEGFKEIEADPSKIIWTPGLCG